MTILVRVADTPASIEENSGFESVGDILKRIRFDRASLEAHITEQFDQTLSLQLDAALLAEESGEKQGINKQGLTA